MESGRDKTRCDYCESRNIHDRKTCKPQPFRYREYRRLLSVKIDTLMHGSNIPPSKSWTAIYIYWTNVKWLSSMMLHRELETAQKSARYLDDRAHEAWYAPTDFFAGPVGVNETYTVGKAAFCGIKDSVTNHVSAEVVEPADASTLTGLVNDRTELSKLVFADDARAYGHIKHLHRAVKHYANDFVNDDANANGIERMWAILKGGVSGVRHRVSLNRVFVGGSRRVNLGRFGGPDGTA